MIRSSIVDYDPHRYTVYTQLINSPSGRRRFRSQAQTYVRCLTSRQWNNTDLSLQVRLLGWERFVHPRWMQSFTRYEFSPLCQFLANQLPLAALLFDRGLSNTYLCPYCHQVESRFHLFSYPAYAHHRPDCLSDRPYFIGLAHTTCRIFTQSARQKVPRT